MSRYQKGKTNLDFTEARDSKWQRHQLGHMQVCISLQTDNLARTPPLSFLQAGCPSCHPTNSVKALKAYDIFINATTRQQISVYSILIVICLLVPPTWKKIVPPTFPNVGVQKNVFARFARKSRFVPLTFKIVAPPRSALDTTCSAGLQLLTIGEF